MQPRRAPLPAPAPRLLLLACALAALAAVRAEPVGGCSVAHQIELRPLPPSSTDAATDPAGVDKPAPSDGSSRGGPVAVVERLAASGGGEVALRRAVSSRGSVQVCRGGGAPPGDCSDLDGGGAAPLDAGPMGAGAVTLTYEALAPLEAIPSSPYLALALHRVNVTTAALAGCASGPVSLTLRLPPNAYLLCRERALALYSDSGTAISAKSCQACTAPGDGAGDGAGPACSPLDGLNVTSRDGAMGGGEPASLTWTLSPLAPGQSLTVSLAIGVALHGKGLLAPARTGACEAALYGSGVSTLVTLVADVMFPFKAALLLLLCRGLLAAFPYSANYCPMSCVHAVIRHVFPWTIPVIGALVLMGIAVFPVCSLSVAAWEYGVDDALLIVGYYALALYALSVADAYFKPNMLMLGAEMSRPEFLFQKLTARFPEWLPPRAIAIALWANLVFGAWLGLATVGECLVYTLAYLNAQVSGAFVRANRDVLRQLAKHRTKAIVYIPFALLIEPALVALLFCLGVLSAEASLAVLGACTALCLWYFLRPHICAAPAPTGNKDLV